MKKNDSIDCLAGVNENRIRVTVLGTGTSTGVPAIGCECEVCRSEAPENKRLRCSIYVEHASGNYLVDCSADLRQQALRYRLPRVDAVLVTHDHADHINGMDDLRIYNYLQGAPIHIHALEDVLETLRVRYSYCFNPTQIGGGLPRIQLRRIEPDRSFYPGRRDGDTGGPSLKVTPIPVKHGNLDILGFRLGRDFAYLTDCSAVPDSSVALLEGVKVLVVSALRPTPHPTHFSLHEALEFSRLLAPEQTWFTHMTCSLEHFATNASLPPEAQLLHDGQVIEVEA